MNENAEHDRDCRILVITPDRASFDKFSSILSCGQAIGNPDRRFTLHHADDCLSGLDKTDQISPDVVFLDEKIECQCAEPVVDLLHQKNPKLPIVILTGHRNEFVAANVFHSSVRDFISVSKLQYEPLLSIIDDAIATVNDSITCGHELSVLVIDGDANDRDWIARNLKNLNTIAVNASTASSLQEANGFLAKKVPDCVLIDDAFPCEGSIAFIRKTILSHPFLPVITLTRLGRESIATESIRCGAKHYLVKATLTGEILDSTIRSAVEQKHLERKIADRDAKLYQAQRKAAEWRERLELVVDSAEAVIWDVDYGSASVTVNNQFNKLFGYNINGNTSSIEEIHRLLHPEDSPGGIFGQQQDASSNTVGSITRIQCSDGSYKWIQSRGKIVERRACGRPLRAAGIIIDVTQQKENADDVARKNQELQRFTHVASHDLREPLRMITCFTDLLRQEYAEQLDEDANRYIDFANNNAKRMQELISDLLEYSRFGSSQSEPEEVDLNLAMQDLRQDLAMAIEETNAELRCEALPTILAVPTKMYSLLQNLITNSIKYSDRSRPLLIEIRSKVENGYCTISVMDNGIGMDPKFDKKIFEPFQRLHGREEYSGTGIGLAICKRIVTEMGGRITVETAIGVGSTFHICIPDQLLISTAPCRPRELVSN
ncbi:PAS domain-containing protein [Stieleria sp. JC731]|uniref:ATP-binding protein n=1 Tax=Pirellulaceae TaxID=2691357 RepID=UPI001E2D9042|nr:ATP-binding protein [Stieleria sp. JC731]MCC9603292.1 PAS domain-containing protein [Stieleria sp. JC731]